MIAKTERNRTAKGCFKLGVKSYTIDNILYKSCIGNYVAPIDFYIEAFSLYEKGMLPYLGTLGEQPNKIIEIFQVIDRRRTIKNNEANNKANAKK